MQAASLRNFALRRYGVRRTLGRFCVAQIVVRQGLELGVQLIYQWNAIGYVDTHDGLIGDAVEVFHQRAYRVSVRRHQYALARTQARRHRFVPKRHDPRHGVFQTFGQGDLFWMQLASLRNFALRRHGVRRTLCRLCIAQIVVRKGLELGVKLVYQWNAIGYVDANDGLIGDSVKVFHQRAD